MKKTLLSGVKPTGKPHIGNYFGAMKQFVDLQDEFNGRIFIADLHALTTLNNKNELNQNITDIVLDYLAIGLDPKKTVIFAQSDFPQITELAWIFNCLVTVPYLMRAHAYKDAQTKNEEVNVGTFNYPVLMAADILIQDADVVPVGRDQKQHIEIARDIAEKFNRVYANGNEFFRTPEPLIIESVETVPGIDGRKMSKSYDNTIPLFASDEQIDSQVMKIVTDSGADIPQNVYAIHKLFKSETELKELYEQKKGLYKDLKLILAEDIKNYFRPMRERRAELEKDKNLVPNLLQENRKIVLTHIDKKLEEVKKLVGLKN
jgi:tryptophanyl-tRNA synthetase